MLISMFVQDLPGRLKTGRQNLCFGKLTFVTDILQNIYSIVKKKRTLILNICLLF